MDSNRTTTDELADVAEKVMHEEKDMLSTENIFKAILYASLAAFVFLFLRLLYQICVKLFSSKNSKDKKKKNILTRSKPFRMMVESTFKSMDDAKKGEVSKDQLYSGLLLVHLKLAKFAGAPACYPPAKPTVDTLFDAADHDGSGGIDQEEFSSIMAVSCAQILSRMVMYYLILMLFVPFASTQIVNFLPIDEGSILEKLTESIVGFIMFSVAIPVVWNAIDDASRKNLEKKPSQEIANNNKNNHKKDD